MFFLFYNISEPIGNSSVGLNFNLNMKNKIHHYTAAKRILKLVKLKVWLQNVVKCGKCSLGKFANFMHFCISSRNLHPLRRKTSQNYIFRTLHHFATKLCYITNFNMFILAVGIDFVHVARIKL